MPSVFSYFGRSLVRPRRTFERLQTEPKAFAKGLRVMILIGFIYTLTATALAAAGALLPAPAFLPLASPNYYFYEIFFAAPTFLAAWILSAGGASLFSMVVGGKGPFKGTASALAYAFSLPAFLMWLPQAVFAGFLLLGMSQEEFMSYTAAPGPWRTGAWIYQGFALLLLISRSVKAVSVGRKLKPVPALIVGLVAAGLFGVVVGLCIR
jgi:hypothetical protein